MLRLKGIGVSPGLVAGRAVILIQRAQALRYQVSSARVARELGRLEQSRSRSRQQLSDIRTRVIRRRGPELGSIFDAQLLMLDDPLLLPRAAEIIREQRVNAEWAIQQAFDEFSAVFEEAADPYLRERRGDVADLVGRLRMNMRQGGATPRDMLQALDESSVLIADELTPSVAAQVDWTRVRGFATDAGSRTYHTAIFARSLEVPAVVGLHDASRRVTAGQLVVIDAGADELVVDPSPELLARVERQATEPPPAVVVTQGRQGAVTADGVRITLEANIELVADLATARYAGAEGIGLFRSEFLLGSGDGPVSEEKQYDAYRAMVEGMAPDPVTVRTFDVDEEQLAVRTAGAEAAAWGADTERGSRQGLRGLRLCLARPDLFQTQLRALLRAARHGSLRILFPFVSSVEQVREARRMIAEAAEAVTRGGGAVGTPSIGVMIEVPAAAYTADLIAKEVDFLTIGTNDLIQYCLAVDRADERVSTLYAPLHPAILRLILMVRRAASRRRIPVSLCGEMASDPVLLTLLVGLGLTSFSMTPGAIPVARQVLAECRADELRAVARRVLGMQTTDEIERELAAVFGRLTLTRE